MHARVARRCLCRWLSGRQARQRRAPACGAARPLRDGVTHRGPRHAAGPARPPPGRCWRATPPGGAREAARLSGLRAGEPRTAPRARCDDRAAHDGTRASATTTARTLSRASTPFWASEHVIICEQGRGAVGGQATNRPHLSAPPRHRRRSARRQLGAPPTEPHLFELLHAAGTPSRYRARAQAWTSAAAILNDFCRRKPRGVWVIHRL